MNTEGLSKIKEVRSRTEASIKACRAALIESGWDVETAVALLLTHEDLTRERNNLLAVHIVKNETGADSSEEEKARLTQVFLNAARREVMGENDEAEGEL